MKTKRDEILAQVAAFSTPGFFVTVIFDREGEAVPVDMESFVGSKLALINRGATGRKYIYQKEGWRMVFTFFPTDRVVDERYALKNKVLCLKFQE